jgi:hypothetical protein
MLEISSYENLIFAESFVGLVTTEVLGNLTAMNGFLFRKVRM